MTTVSITRQLPEGARTETYYFPPNVCAALVREGLAHIKDEATPTQPQAVPVNKEIQMHPLFDKLCDYQEKLKAAEARADRCGQDLIKATDAFLVEKARADKAEAELADAVQLLREVDAKVSLWNYAQISSMIDAFLAKHKDTA